MLEVGNGMSEVEDRSHFALWCILASPLIAGNDLRSMTPTTKAILTSRGAIAVNQVFR
jgi:alpha-galactosidase